VAIFFFFRKIIANLYNRKAFARFGPKNIKKGILCGNFLLFPEKYRQFYFLIVKSIRHIWAKKHFVENFHQPFGEKAFQKKLLNIHFLPKIKKSL
jgi:hypothetical protein